MKTFSRSGIIPAVLTYALLGSSCRTAEFKSVPKERKPVDRAAEIITTPEVEEPEVDVPPVRVQAPNPIVETAVAPTSEELNGLRQDIEEKFRQESFKGIADILVVVDNSISMNEEQKNLSDKMGSLVKSLVEVDWQIGVITTSAIKQNGHYLCDLKLIRSTDPNPKDKFAEAVKAGISGSNNEQGILQSVVGLRCEENPWVRPRSTIAVLIVTDEDNCSNGLGCRGQDGEKETYLIDYVEKDLGRTVGLTAGFYGIYSPPQDECKSAFHPAYIYDRLINYRVKDQKNFGKICDPSYESTLERISKNIANLIKKTYELKNVPLAGTLKVEGKKANGTPITAEDYELVDKVIGFKIGSEPMVNTEITATYQILRPR